VCLFYKLRGLFLGIRKTLEALKTLKKLVGQSPSPSERLKTFSRVDLGTF
jgi:hypothetical protein